VTAGGALVVVGTGIGAARLTTEAKAELAGADEVFFLVPDALTEHAIRDLAPDARSLGDAYEEGRSRREAYERIVETLLEPARAGRRVCAAFYGHPGMFVFPSREAVARARAEGIEARLQPGISALDCLFADLGVDPAASGFQSYEAGDFLRRRPVLEPRAGLVLWQVGVVGQAHHTPDGEPVALAELVEALLETYPAEQELVVYEASSYPGVDSIVRTVALGALDPSVLSSRSTVYVPPQA